MNTNSATIDVTIYQRPIVGFVDSSSLSVENKTETVLKKLGKKVYHYGSLHILPYRWDPLSILGSSFWRSS